MRVVHAPTEIAGQMGILCRGLKSLNIEVNGYNWFHSYLGYRDHVVNTDAYELIRLIDPLVKYSDIFHFHNGNTMLIDHVDLPYIAGVGKKVLMHHWGNDVRSSKRSLSLNSYHMPLSYLTDKQIHDRLVFLSRYIKTAIVQDYELYPYVQDYYEDVRVIPLACDMTRFKPAYPSESVTAPVIIHAPTNRDFKGTEVVEKTIRQLQGKRAFHYVTVERMSHQQALQTYLSADIVIDQILCGTYGMLSVEAMAMGKVAVAYVRDDVRNRLPEELPIVNAHQDNLYDVLDHLLVNPEQLRPIGQAGRRFVERHHAVEYVAQALVAIYEQL